MLSQSVSILKINVTNILKNYHFIKQQSGGKKIAAVVKTNAYGLGIKKIAPALFEFGCNDFFVANLAEAIHLRKILPNANIYVFHGISQNEESIFFDNNLIPIINSAYQGEIWKSYLKKINQKPQFYVHIDTGMNRLGFKNINDDFLLANKQNIKMILSHYACADDADNEKNLEQFELIKNIRNKFPNTSISLANSAASFLNQEFHGDMLRVGICIYGGNPDNKKTNPMLNVIELLAPILQINHIKKGETIGYGASFTAQNNMITATLPIGYADGYFRCLSNNSYCYFNGYKLPVIGRVSMDLITIDISNIAAKVNIGDYIEIIGNNVTIDDLAQQASTISYEILTNLGSRFKRIYINK